MYTIQVFTKTDGKPEVGKKVQVFYKGFFNGNTQEMKTDEKGEAHFDYDNGRGEVYVNGRRAYEGEICGRVIVYI